MALEFFLSLEKSMLELLWGELLPSLMLRHFSSVPHGMSVHALHNFVEQSVGGEGFSPRCCDSPTTVCSEALISCLCIQGKFYGAHA